LNYTRIYVKTLSGCLPSSASVPLQNNGYSTTEFF